MAETLPENLQRYDLLAQSVSGRAVTVAGTSAACAHTDGSIVYVPPLGERWTTAAVVVQAALLDSGALAPSAMTKIAGRRRAIDRYTLLEVVRATQRPGSAVPRWVAREVRAVYDGPVPASLDETLEWTYQSRRKLPEPPPWLGTVKPLRVLRTRPAAPVDADSSEQVDPQKVKRIQAPRQLDDDEESDSSALLNAIAGPRVGALGAKLQDLMGMGRTPSAKKSTGFGAEGAEMSVDGNTRLGANSTVHRALGGADDERGFVVTLVPTGKRYPEWDTHDERYRPEWCSVTEFDPAMSGEIADLPTMRDPKLRQKLARLGLKAERHRRQQDGDTLDIEAVVEMRVDLHVGGTVDPRVYETRMRTARDLGVLVLLDSSGSTGESTSGKQVFDEQRALAGRLTAALEELGNRVATYGFRSTGRDVQFLRVKDFDDRFDHGSRRRLAALEPSGYTRLGAAIRHSTWMLSERAGTSITLLIVIGDGLPYDDGYENIYAQDDVRRALREGVLRGVGCACVSARATTDHDILDRAWGSVPYRRVEEAEDLAEHAHEMFATAIRESVASRRSIERRAA